MHLHENKDLRHILRLRIEIHCDQIRARSSELMIFNDSFDE